MPAFCSVVGCGNRSERDKVRFFRIPAALKDRGIYLDALSKDRRERWIKALKRGDLGETFWKNARVCSNHFLLGAPSELLDKDNPDWVPSQNMGYTSINSKNEEASQRHIRVVERRKRRLLEVASAEHESDSMPNTSADELIQEDLSKCVQTDIAMDDLENLFNDLTFSNERIYSLEKKLKSLEISENSFMDDDSKVLYFTGFPSSKMMFRIFSTVKSKLSSKSTLTEFQQFVLTLMRLRLNLPFKYLAYRFCISPPTASETFYKCIDIFYTMFKKLVFWPERDLLVKNMPACFKENFGNRVAVIIDCFEIFTETPSGLLNAARCWSSYKHHQTAKFLIGITPQGTISYISSAWGGRTSDKYLTENCGFLELLSPGDVILADRGFLIRDSVKILGAHIEIPAFTKGQKQLHPIDVESTRKIANVRIHVERVIGLLKKKYKICNGPLPISTISINRDDMSAIDKILVVCSAFLNLCPSQIPMA